jgi:EpsI family protein
VNRVLALIATLLLSLGLRLWLASAPVVPARPSFGEFPRQLGRWEFAAEGTISSRLEPVLGADDYLLRSYRSSAGEAAELFAAYYAVQNAGESMHSPKNCLGGAGWDPIQRGSLALMGSGASRAGMVNSYIVEKDGERFLIVYWYHVHGRMIASEYWLKAYLVWDAICHRRRDGALVRITVPLHPGSNGKQELETAVDLGRASLPYLSRFIPS